MVANVFGNNWIAVEGSLVWMQVGGAGILRWWLLGLSVVGKGERNRRVLDPATCFVVSGWNSTQAFVEDTVE
jgi:hypothetical protein